MRGGWRERFLKLLESDDRETRCAELAGVSRQYVARLKRIDPEFEREIAVRISIYRSTALHITLSKQRREQVSFR